MKRMILFLIPIVLVFLIVFAVVKLFILPESGKGALQVTSQPLSKVYVDGNYIGNTPLCRCEAATMLRAGEYTLKLEPLDKALTPFQEKITITKGVLTVVDRKFGKGATSEGSIISLTPLSDKNATELLVLSFPDTSEAFVDTATVGKTPLHMKGLTDSDHTLKIRREGYKDKNVRIRTPKGFKLTAVVYLSLKDGNEPTTTNTPTASPSAQLSPTVRVSPTVAVSGTVVITQTPNGFLRVREEPTTTAAEITRVATGDSFTLVSEQSGWYEIELEDGTSGWISATYARKE